LQSEAITALADDSEFRKVLGQNARDYAVKHLDKNFVLGNFEDNLHKCLGGRYNH